METWQDLKAVFSRNNRDYYPNDFYRMLFDRLSKHQCNTELLSTWAVCASTRVYTFRDLGLADEEAQALRDSDPTAIIAFDANTETQTYEVIYLPMRRLSLCFYRNKSMRDEFNGD